MVLVGDAAHPSMPNMGQGTSQAFEDAAVLADRLGSAPSVEAALLGYEYDRRRRANATWWQARDGSAGKLAQSVGVLAAAANVELHAAASPAATTEAVVRLQLC